jgi:tetratricopeptide (TPR) repeat protein
VHYIYDNSLIPKLSAYFDLRIDRNLPVEDTMQQSFGLSVADFDRSLRDYVSSGRSKYFPIPTPSNSVSSEYVARPLSPADSGAILADMHLHSLDYREKAIAEFQQILSVQPNHAAACRGLGYAYLQKRDFTQAAEYFKRAAQADSRDPRVHYYSALLMRREGAFTNQSDLPEMIKHLDTAIALDPTFADPYMLLAFAQMYAGDPAKGLITMQKAASLSPRNENYQFNLAQMYLNNQKPDPAISILQVLRNCSNPELAQMSGGLLAEAQQFKAATQEQHAADSGAGLRTDREAPVNGSIRIEKSSAAEEGVGTISNQTPPDFLRGTIVSVDCSSPPVATLAVVSGGKNWKMQVQDSKHILLIGADSFSCSWSKQKVALNYRETGDAAGNVISIEVQ